MSVIINELEVSLADERPVSPGADPGPPPAPSTGKALDCAEVVAAHEHQERRRRRLEAC